VAVAQDWVRMYMITMLVIIDPLTMAGITAFFLLLSYFQLFVFNYWVLGGRKDLQLTLTTVLTFPFYKMATTLMFRQYAMMENIMSYSLNLKPHSIKYRCEDQKVEIGMSDIPPTPFSAEPDWWHVWTVSDDRPEDLSPTTGARRATDMDVQAGARHYIPRQVVDEVERICADQIKARDSKMQAKLHHMVLGEMMFRKLLEEDTVMGANPTQFNEIKVRMETCVLDMLKDDRDTPKKYRELITTQMREWANQVPLGTGKPMFMTSLIARKTGNWQKDVAGGNVEALMEIETELSKLGFPLNKNPLSIVEKKIHEACEDLRAVRSGSRTLS